MTRAEIQGGHVQGEKMKLQFVTYNRWWYIRVKYDSDI